VRYPQTCEPGTSGSQHGLERVRQPHVDRVQGKLWEIRLKGAAGIARALYVTAKPRRVVVVRVFVKKTQKTPKAEIKLALERAKRVKDDQA
jgi:phage-related protein